MVASLVALDLGTWVSVVVALKFSCKELDMTEGLRTAQHMLPFI